MKNLNFNLTEKDAATAYAKAWNSLDCSDFIKLLADDAHYSSQYVLEEQTSKKAITEYLNGKLGAVRNSDTNVTADIGIVRKGYPGRDCTILSQGDNDAVILFEINDGKIKRFDLCMPELMDARKSGVCPK
jgi:hypothetical protein